MDAKIAELQAVADLTHTSIHKDMDAFFASVEELDNPSLVCISQAPNLGTNAHRIAALMHAPPHTGRRCVKSLPERADPAKGALAARAVCLMGLKVYVHAILMENSFACCRKPSPLPLEDWASSPLPTVSLQFLAVPLAHALLC